MYTPKKTNDELKTKQCVISAVSDVDAEECCFFNVELKIPYQKYSIFLCYINTFL